MTELNKTQEFIDIYKKFERLLRDQYKGSVLDYENTLPQTEMEKLRICRQIRNYIQHHDNDFLVCSQAMCDFINELIRKENDNSYPARVLSLKPVCLTDRISDIMGILTKSKRNWMPVTDSDNKYYGTIDLTQLIRISSHNSPNTKLASAIPSDFFRNNPIIALRENHIDEFEGNDAVIVRDNREYIGVLK